MYLLAIICSVWMLAFDRMSKGYVIHTFDLGETKFAVSGLFDFTYIHNTGGAWGILSGKTWFFVLFALGMFFIGVYFLWKTWKKNALIFWGINLAISGGTGNLIDRIFNNGQVIDFIRLEFIDFPIFNVADISIVVGCGLIILSTVIDIVQDYKGGKSNIQNINLSK